MQATTERKRPATKAPIDQCESYHFKVNGVFTSIRVWRKAAWYAIPVLERPLNALVSVSEKTVAVFAAHAESQTEIPATSKDHG